MSPWGAGISAKLERTLRHHQGQPLSALDTLGSGRVREAHHIDGRTPGDLAASDSKARWSAGTGRKELHALFVGLDSHGALRVDPALPHTPTKRPLMTAKP